MGAEKGMGKDNGMMQLHLLSLRWSAKQQLPLSYLDVQLLQLFETGMQILTPLPCPQAHVQTIVVTICQAVVLLLLL